MAFAVFENWPLVENSAPRTIVIGPSRAGKTSLLCCLQHASAQWRDRRDGIRSVVIQPRSDAMRDLLRDGRVAMIRHGKFEAKINATTNLGEFSFDLRIRRSMWFGWTLRNPRSWFALGDPPQRFTVWDTAGGVLLSQDAAEATSGEAAAQRRSYLEQLRQAKGLLLCIDVSGGNTTAGAVFASLPVLLADLGTSVLPFSRLVVLLCKCDRLASGESKEDVDVADPIGAATRLMTRGALQALLDSMPEESEIAFGFASAFGFTVEDGSPNYNANTDGLKTFKEGDISENERSWVPYRVIEPFVYLATGHRCGLKVLRGRDSVPNDGGGGPVASE